ncbi:MAG: hypothetical protein CXT73_00595 [Methanobacteriota archaeon]|jgi:hypothetical protein|nr:MAG: hypothetical protein CXT73_00595 [Euryarchaeota archaeon]
MYCSAPWTAVQIKNNGTFSYCCQSEDPIGNTLNSIELIKGRQEIINGNILPTCQSKCFDIEKNKLYESQRTFLNKIFPIENNVSEIANIDHIQYIDLRMGNICNYLCTMCGSNSSHLWAKLYKKEKPYVDWQQDHYDEIINFIFNCKNLKCIALAGGEPFYNKRKLFGLIDKLSRSIILKFITNTSFCDDDIIDKLNEFKTGKLHCSIDGVGKWIENQRLGSNWNQLEQNIFNFAKKLHSNWEIVLVPTFTVINTLGLEEFIDWYFNKLIPIRKVTFRHNICTYPVEMTLYNIPLMKRQKIIENIKSMNYQNTSDGLFQLYDSICKDIKPDNDTIKDFLNRMSFIKHNTKHDVIKHIPELNKLGENNVNTRTN